MTRRLTAGTAQRLDASCVICHTERIFTVDVYDLTDSGVTQYPPVTFCYCQTIPTPERGPGDI